jgi:alkylation response protein AidB-like acyl-CoA dehydrogenase
MQISTEEASERQEILRLAAGVALDMFGSVSSELDVNRTPVSHADRRRLGELGFLGITLPARFGGSDAHLMQALVVIEEFAKVCRPAAFQVFEATTGPAQAVNRLATEEQKERWLPAIITGERTMAVAITEPDAGSAATDMRTRAAPYGDGFLLTGAKRWVSNGGEADQYLVYCRMGDGAGAKGIGAVVVDADSEGVSFGTPERLMGFRGIPSADIYFDDVVVPAENVVVNSGSFRRLFSAFSIERLGNATMSLAIGQAALDATVAYVQEREQFGKQLVEFQGVQIQLADMVLQVEAARLLIERAASRVTSDGDLPDAFEVSVAKCAANEMAKRVSDMAIQLHGGVGYSEEFGIERLHRDAHGWAIAGGTPMMQRTRIVSEMLGRSFDQRR